MGALLRCEVISSGGSDSGQGRTDGGRRSYESYSPPTRTRTRRKPRIAPKCRKLLSKCMSGGTAKGRRGRAGKCMRKFQRCRRKG